MNKKQYLNDRTEKLLPRKKHGKTAATIENHFVVLAVVTNHHLRQASFASLDNVLSYLFLRWYHTTKRWAKDKMSSCL